VAVVAAFFVGFWLFGLTALGIGYGVFVFVSNKLPESNLN